MIIECLNCEAKVDAKEVAHYEQQNEFDPPAKYTFLKCVNCASPFLILQENFGSGWDEPYRIFPPQDKRVNPLLPKPIKSAYEEALACFKAKAFTAVAMMCRKTIEGICNEHGANEKTLASNLRQLKEKGIIESRLFEWAEALRMFGNEAAHDVNITFSREDAKHILEFTDALLEYVFTFRDKFSEFMKKRKNDGKSVTKLTPKH